MMAFRAASAYNEGCRPLVSPSEKPSVKLRSFLAVLPLFLAATAVRAAEPFPLKDGDRVVFVGNTLIEREQRYGYWETALTSRYHGRNITFRNLGWSGDTVWGDARAGFGKQIDGFNHLKEHVLALKPTVIIIGYGGNEAFAGPESLPKFEKGFNTLLDTFGPAKARIVLLGPPPQEDLPRPLPDPAEQNKNLRLYSNAIKEAAKKRELAFVDLYELFGEAAKTPGGHLTEDELHLTAQGYYRTAESLMRGFRSSTAGGEEKFDKTGASSFKITLAKLPAPMPPSETSPEVQYHTNCELRVSDLKGKYSLFIDGKEVQTATGEEWEAGVLIKSGPDVEQAEKLRLAIIEKNRLYFHRWRPQNETYLFGFRKAEQGKNSVEIPQFDPLVVKQEEEIAKLRVPAAHLYELKKAK
jgi:lysophospholipase L1-like esterase